MCMDVRKGCCRPSPYIFKEHYEIRLWCKTEQLLASNFGTAILTSHSRVTFLNLVLHSTHPFSGCLYCIVSGVSVVSIDILNIILFNCYVNYSKITQLLAGFQLQDCHPDFSLVTFLNLVSHSTHPFSGRLYCIVSGVSVVSIADEGS